MHDKQVVSMIFSSPDATRASLMPACPAHPPMPAFCQENRSAQHPETACLHHCYHLEAIEFISTITFHL